MPIYYVRRATEQTPGISDLEELGELNILKDGKSVVPCLWPHDAVWNTLIEVEASSSELAAVKLWLETLVCNSSHTVDADGLTQNRFEILWDESDCMMEVQEPNFDNSESIIRIYRIVFDLDHGLHALLLSKVLVKNTDNQSDPFIVTRLETLD
jgi:hypothetical protein